MADTGNQLSTTPNLDAPLHEGLNLDAPHSDLDETFALDAIDSDEGDKTPAPSAGDTDKDKETQVEAKDKGTEADDASSKSDKDTETGSLEDKISAAVAKATEGIRNEMISERRARQQLEQRNAQLEGFLQGFGSTEDGEDDDLEFFDNPSEKIEEVVKQHVTKAEQEYTNRIMRLSMANARARHEDFDDVRQEFLNTVSTLPQEAQMRLDAEILSADDPAEYAYQWMQNRKSFGDAKSIDELVTKKVAAKEKEIRESILAELKEKGVDTALSEVVPSNAGTRGASATPAPDIETEFSNPTLDFDA